MVIANRATIWARLAAFDGGGTAANVRQSFKSGTSELPPPAAVVRVPLRLTVRVVVGLESRDARREAAAVDFGDDAVLRVGDLADVVEVLVALETRDASLTALVEVVPQLLQRVLVGSATAFTTWRR